MADDPNRSIVIDASVARSCGDGNARARMCKDFLKTATDVRLRAVMTQTLTKEWSKHSSGYARTWFVSMTGKRLLKRIQDAENSLLRRKMRQTTDDNAVNEAMMKDVFLIEAALATDNTIVSLDEKARYHFRISALSVDMLSNIVWVNPGSDDEAPIPWAQQGAKPEPCRTLGWRTEQGKHTKNGVAATTAGNAADHG